MSNILLVGNGFDLAHGLATKYEHFLYLMKNWKDFKNVRELVSKGMGIGDTNVYFKYLRNIDKINEDNLKRLDRIMERNSWIKYFSRCEAEIDGWIDFEKEIYPVIELFEVVFGSAYTTYERDGGLGQAEISRNIIEPKLIRIAGLWDKYFDVSGVDIICVKSPYASVQYGILKKKILEDLRKEFDEFILAFEIYLHEFVYKNRETKVLKQIKDLDIGSVINFNYTLTERLYGIDEENTHHIHGMIRDDLSIGKNNMVVGVNEQENQNIDFIYFVKYFQRIQKESGTKYKEFEKRNLVTKYGVTCTVDYKVYIYGHSLDETDEDILKHVIGYVNEKKQLILRPDQVVIFFHDDADYEQKVVNLIKLYGRSIVEEYMEDEKFKFVKTTSEEWIES